MFATLILISIHLSINLKHSYKDMEKLNAKTVGKLLKSSRRNTLYEKILNNNIKIPALAAATGITTDRLYRVFDIPTSEELDKIEHEITKVAIVERHGEIEMLHRLGYHVLRPTETAMMDDNELLVMNAAYPRDHGIRASEFVEALRMQTIGSKANDETVSTEGTCGTVMDRLIQEENEETEMLSNGDLAVLEKTADGVVETNPSAANTKSLGVSPLAPSGGIEEEEFLNDIAL